MKQAIGFLQYSSEYICFSAISESDKEKLLEEGYLASFFPSCVYAIDCKIFNHPHHGIGIRNINGGVEFLNFNNMKDPISLHKRGISIIPSNNESKNRCILFLTITDYLAYKALVNLPIIFYDDNCDCIILNNHKNLGYFLVESEDYNIIDMFLPNTETGKTLTKTILDRNAAARDWAYTYKDYTSLQTFLQSYIKENKI